MQLDRALLNTNQCSFNKETKTLTVSAEVFQGCFPREIGLTSDQTGRFIHFDQDTVAAEANEFWDGEMLVYVPCVELPNCKKLVVTRF